MLHRSLDGNRWNSWDQLGGAFTSPPVVLPGASGTFDIFARGLEFLIYRTTRKPGTLAQWEALGGGLLGEPTAASSPAAIRVRNNIFVFVTGIDGAIWYTVFDGNYWKAWASLDVVETAASGYAAGLGGAISFISEPVVAAFSWEQITPIGGTALVATTGGPPAAYAEPTPNIAQGIRVDVSGVGTNNPFLHGSSLWHKWLDSNGWHGQLDSDGHDTGNGN
jgi:hypothetical protein